MDLKQFRDTVLRLGSPEDVLSLADKYLTQMQEMQADFVLPREHLIVKPVLEHYFGDLPGWVKFVKSVRDRMPTSGRQYHVGVHELYRKLDVRLTQTQRRARLDAAVAAAVAKKLLVNDYDTKMKYARRCTQIWKQRKDNMLKAHVPKSGRLSVEERDELLTSFWTQIDEEVRRGEVPKP